MSDLPNNILIYTIIFVLKIHSLKPHLWCCQTPSAFLPLSLQSYRRAQRGQTCHRQTPAAEVGLHLSRGASPLRCRLLVSLLELCLGFVLSNNQKHTALNWNTHTHMQKKYSKRWTKKYHSNLTDLPVTLFEMLDKFHQVCWVSDDFKVEFFNWKTFIWREKSLQV